jgi:hypothetical protein
MAEFSPTDLRQRRPLLRFYLLALSFAVALILTGFFPAPWPRMLYVAMAMIAALAVWMLIRFLRVADERQRRINFRSLRFGFIAGLMLSLLGGFVQGFGIPRVSWLGVLGLQLISWSVGLIYYSWRDQ